MVLLSLMPACGSVTVDADAGPGDTNDGGAVIDAGDTGAQREVVATVPTANVENLDVLFVIDNSNSMLEEQTSLAANFGRFIDVLESAAGGLPNLHVGIISTDLGAGRTLPGCVGNGDNGVLQSEARGMCTPPSGAYLSDVGVVGGGRERNYTGTLSEAFSCIARLGTGGCGFEQPLEAMRRALDGSNRANDGFLRPAAKLAVVFLTDEDDCSVVDDALFDIADDSLGPTGYRCFEYGVECLQGNQDPRAPGSRSGCGPRTDSAYVATVSDYVSFLQGLKSTPGAITVAGIVGNPTPVIVGTDQLDMPALQPSCTSAAGNAAPAVRLAAFLDSFPARNSLTSVCNEDLSGALTRTAGNIAQREITLCLDGAIADTDSGSPGVQPDCTVAEITGDGDTAVPECDDATDPASSTNKPCYQIRTDDGRCDGTATRLAMTVYRNVAPSTDGRVEARCRVE